MLDESLEDQSLELNFEDKKVEKDSGNDYVDLSSESENETFAPEEGFYYDWEAQSQLEVQREWENREKETPKPKKKFIEMFEDGMVVLIHWG